MSESVTQSLSRIEVAVLIQAVEQSPCAIVITDTTGAISYVNEKFCSVTGYTREEAIGQNPRILKSGELSDDEYKGLWQCISVGGAWRGEFHNRKKNGELFWETAYIAGVRSSDGNITHYIAIKEDITEQKRIQKELDRQREEYSHLFNQMVNAFAVFRVCHKDGAFEHSHLEECNPAFEIMADMNKEDLTGKCLSAIMKEQSQLWHNIFSSVIQGQAMYFDECQLGEDACYYSLTAYLASADRVAFIFNNVTFYKQAQAELLAKNERLDELNHQLKDNQKQLVQSEKLASIGQLAAGVAHEINNPIGFITSNVSTLTEYVHTYHRLLEAYQRLEDLAELSGQADMQDVIGEVRQIKQAEDLEFIQEDIVTLLQESEEGTGRVSDIVRNLKSFARADDKDLSETDLNETIENTLKIVWNELKYKCTVVREFGDIPRILCNAGELSQVFLNLLVNGGHAIKDEGTITIRTDVEGDFVRVVISDTGCGIPPDILPRIFDPFYTTKDVGKGTGLGLSISHGIVEKHGGTIFAESVIGQGTAFTIMLPLHGDQHAAMP